MEILLSWVRGVRWGNEHKCVSLEQLDFHQMELLDSFTSGAIICDAKGLTSVLHFDYALAFCWDPTCKITTLKKLYCNGELNSTSLHPTHWNWHHGKISLSQVSAKSGFILALLWFSGIYADGPGAYLFHGVVEQQYIFHVMDHALCLSDSKSANCERHSTRNQEKNNWRWWIWTREFLCLPRMLWLIKFK